MAGPEAKNAPEPLAPRVRFAGTLAAWLVLFAASPGNAGPDGSLVLALAGLALLGAVLVHPLALPGEPVKRSLALEYAAHVVGSGIWFYWLAYVTPLALLWVAPAYALYFLALGPLLRRLHGRLPFALAFAAAACGLEALRSAIPTPFGLAWFRMGHFAHGHLWLSGSARVYGIEGLSAVCALAAGGLAGAALGWLRARRLPSAELALGAAGPVLALVLSSVTGPPDTEEGPRLLLVQPGIEESNLGLDESTGQLVQLLQLTHRALEALRERGARAPDLVCWGESMLYHPIPDPSFVEALARGEEPPSWWWEGLDRAWARAAELSLRRGVLDQLFRGVGGAPPILDPGTWFLGGGERYYFTPGTGFARGVTLALFGPDGGRRAMADKRYLCSGAETLHGLEHLAPVRAAFESTVNYVPDFTPADATGLFEVETRSGGAVRFGATLCFDNAFPDPYLEGVRNGAVDFHLVASNEAWYGRSIEMDQMVAFSRVLALATGRSFVRATSSGISLVLGPDGREIGRVEGEGGDKAVAGWVALDVPVPTDRKDFPPYPRLAGGLGALSIAFPLVLLGFLHRPR